jgi:hypothetical protein
MLPTKFRFIWPSGFRGEELKNQPIRNQESPVVVMFVNGSGRNEQSLLRTFHRCSLPSFGSFGQAVSENIKKNLYRDIKDPTPVREQDGKISDTQGKDFWSPTRLCRVGDQ